MKNSSTRLKADAHCAVMDLNINKIMAKIIYSLSEHFGIEIEDEAAVARILNRPTRVRGKSLRRHLQLLLRLVDLHYENETQFWRTIKRYIQRADQTLLGEAISQVRPVIPASFKMLDVPKNIRSILKIADVQFPVPFWFAVPDVFKCPVSKLSEGSFAEVYKILKEDDEVRILKIVPCGDMVPEQDMEQLKFEDVTTEMHVSIELSKLSSGVRYRCSSFPRIHSVCVVQDEFPEPLSEAWRSYSSVLPSRHPSPHLYEPTQAFVTIVTDDVGMNLECLENLDYLTALSVFQQVSTGVSIAEEYLAFEHRDLHSENILVAQCDEEIIPIRIKGLSYRIKSYGIKASVIDFTYSRIEIGGVVKYVDLEPLYYPNPFSELKFLDHRYVYSKMAEVTNRKWKTFCPSTNILWFQHILKYLLSRTKEIELSVFQDLQKEAKRTLETYKINSMLYQSSSAFVQSEVLPTL